MQWLDAIAFALLIGSQFGAVIFVSTKRERLYARPEERIERPEAVKLPSDSGRGPTAPADSETRLAQPERPLRAA